MKKLLPFTLFWAFSATLFAQSAKITPPSPPTGNETARPQLRRYDKVVVPAVENPFGQVKANFKTLAPLQKAGIVDPTIQITKGENGLPIVFRGKTAASGDGTESKPLAERAIDYVASLNPVAIKEPLIEFSVTKAETDEQGNQHVRLQQVYAGVPVYGAEMIAHTKKGGFEMLNGRYFPTPNLSTVTPALNAQAAIEIVKQAIGIERVKNNWTAQDLMILGGEAFRSELVIYHPKKDINHPHLAWHIEAHPNLMTRTIYFIDAQGGEVLHQFDHTCDMTRHRHESSPEVSCETKPIVPAISQPMEVLDGPVNAHGFDLFDIDRTFGAWQAGSQVVMEDASKSMFNLNASNMPNEPVGAIVTVDALNTSPETQSSFNYEFVVSNSTLFNYKTAVSGHWNAAQSYDYFKNTHNRNSIDGVGGNIISFINVSEGDGTSMENAFWNGAAMWYGNGGSTFKKLARGLDVGGHEMTHGVIEKTANLEYQDESGALNESFADVFAAMIDRDDWKIGEDVMQANINPNNCLRSLQDPNNSVSSNSPWWQPKHTNEQYNGNEDNGGVHINSGIVNHAFYLFAVNAAVGKERAEKVYYKALKDYLVKSSQFVDCRIAVIQAANDLYGNAVANAAAAAFTAVGIGGSQPSGNYLGELNPNPGTDLIACVSNNYQNIDLALGNGTVLGTIFNEGVKSRPSMTDNGVQMVFVNEEGHIVGIDFNYNANPIEYSSSILSADPEWRNVAISKDGRFLAAIREISENFIYVYELLPPFTDQVFTLKNPTYSQDPTNTGEVRYADVLEFDYSGDFLMYDAYNELTNGQNDLSYWDIGFVQIRKNNEFSDGDNPFIAKLFSGLPEKTSIGNPAFAKNSPFIIAFDYIDEGNGSNDIYSANSETGDYGVIVTDNGGLGWPNFNRLDNAILFESPDNTGDRDLYLQGLKANKIEPQGNISQLITDRRWGVWFANGTRSLEVGTQDLPSGLTALSASPNPAQDRTTITLNALTAGEATVELMDLLGRTVLNKNIQLAVGENYFDLNVVGLNKAQYLLRVQTKDGLAILKVVTQ